MNKISEVTKLLVQEELDKFELPTGYSVENVKKSKYYLKKVLSFLLASIHVENTLTEDAFEILLDLVGKISNVQGCEIIVKIADKETDQSTLNISGNDIESIVFWKDNIEKTVTDLFNFVLEDRAFMPQNGKKRSYFHNESLVLTKANLK